MAERCQSQVCCSGGALMLDLTEYADLTVEQIVVDIMMIIEEVEG